MLCLYELLSHRDRRTSARGLRIGTTGLLIGLLAGCGNLSPSEATVYPVTGKVLLPDGKPLTSGRVEFMPVKGGMPATGDLGPDGSFSLKTGTGLEGAPAGEYKVRLEPTALASKKKGASPLVYPFPAKYADEDANTGLTATVKAEPNTLEPFKLAK
jgi:hypothetical protein